ncbi:MAG: hypothetical protein ACI4QT_07730, partial [Kiritimatiellia bacterium]
GVDPGPEEFTPKNRDKGGTFGQDPFFDLTSAWNRVKSMFFRSFTSDNIVFRNRNAATSASLCPMLYDTKTTFLSSKRIVPIQVSVLEGTVAGQA